MSKFSVSQISQLSRQYQVNESPARRRRYPMGGLAGQQGLERVLQLGPKRQVNCM